MMEEKKCCCCGSDMQERSELQSELRQPEAGCGCRHKARTEEEMRDLIHRLNRVEGQIRGIRAMVEEDRYCVDILTQVSAAKSALNGFSQALLDQHIRTCVAERLQQGDEEVVDELTGVIRKLMK